MTRPAPAVAVPLVLVPALGLAQGGFSPDAWVWAGALAAWATALAAVLGDGAGLLRRAWPWAAGWVALLAWTFASALWSAHRSQSVLEARRTLCYAAVALALVALGRVGETLALVAATHAAVTALTVYALARYLLGDHPLAEFEGYLLSDPLGYANAVGVVAAAGVLLGLGLGAGARSPLARAAAAATLPPLALALQLSDSHGAWLALAVGLGVAIALDERPLALVRFGVAAAVPSAILVAVGYESGLNAVDPPHVRGWWVALAAVACAAAAAAATRVPEIGRAPLPRVPVRLLLAVGAAAFAAAFALVVVYGATTEPRASYYRVAWHAQVVPHPLLGTGAGTFALYWARSGHVASRGGALDVHSLYLETLAELGPVGLLLLAGALAYPLLAAVRARRAPYVSAAAAAYAAFLVHAGLDWDWEMPVVVVAALACGGAAVAGEGARPRALAAPVRAAVLVAALALGALAVAGARSDTEPGAAGTAEAPLTRGL